MNFSLPNDSCANDPGQHGHGSRRWTTIALGVGTAFAAICLIGCGMSASPQPPSLGLPKPITDATATRAGNQVTLRWTTPRDTTDRLKIRGPVELKICRELEDSACREISVLFSVAGQSGSYIDSLPPQLAAGPLRSMSYEIVAANQHHKSAGPSNKAQVAAGVAPPAVENLSATTVEQGVLLHWEPVSAATRNTSVQLLRTLLTTTNSKDKNTGTALPTSTEPVVQTLRIPQGGDKAESGVALDRSVMFSRRYRYVAVRVSSVKAGGKDLLVSSISGAPVEISVNDVFPPAIPVGLAAVPSSAVTNGGQAEIDLSWSGNVEPDFAQYLIYRRDETGGEASPSSGIQIAPENAAAPVVGPAYRDVHVQPGHTYRYTIVAVDMMGNKSSRSDGVVASVPSQ